MAWQCVGCGLDSSERIPPPICPKCGRVEAYDRTSIHIPPKQVAMVPDVDLPRVSTGEPDIDNLLYGGFIECSRVLLWGRGGTGKSRLAMRWATGSRNALYISLEMYESIAASSARSAGANPNRLYITESYDFFGRKAREAHASIIVLDSISVVPRQEQKQLLRSLEEWAERYRGVVIVICHQNKHGQHAGSHAIQHWGDCEIFLKASKTGATIVEVLKSRGCPVGKTKTVLGKDSNSDTTDDDSASNSNDKSDWLS